MIAKSVAVSRRLLERWRDGHEATGCDCDWVGHAGGGLYEHCAAPQVLNVSVIWIGDWEFEPASAGRGIFTMTLSQNGTEVAGAVQLTGLDRTSPTTVPGVLSP